MASRKAKQKTKLEVLADSEGTDVAGLFAACTFDGACMGICTNPRCDYTTEVEPDQTQGYCEVCNTLTVASAVKLIE